MMPAGDLRNIPLGSWPDPPDNPQPPPQGIHQGPKTAPATPQSFFGAFRGLNWKNAILLTSPILTFPTLQLMMALFVFTITYTNFANRKADRANLLAGQANALNNISLAYSDHAYCVEKKLEHTQSCKDAEMYILDHLGLADRVGWMISESSVEDGPNEQITYSAIEATEFARKSSYWMQCQFISFQGFKKDFGKLVRQMETEASINIEYANDFALQADLVIEQFRHEVGDLKTYYDIDLSPETVEPSFVVRSALQAINSTVLFHSMLISQAYQNAAAVTEYILERRPECESEPDCKIEWYSPLFATTTKSILNATSDTQFVDYRRSRCPEPCRIGLWKSHFFLQKWTDKTRHLLDNQPHPNQTTIAHSTQRQIWNRIPKGPEMKAALIFGAWLAFSIKSSCTERVSGIVMYTLAVLMMLKFALTSEPIEAPSRQFISPVIDILIPSIVIWAFIVTKYSSLTRSVLLPFIAIISAFCVALGVVSVWPPEMFFGTLIHPPKTSTLILDVAGALKIMATFSITSVITFQLLPLLKRTLRILTDWRPVQFHRQQTLMTVFQFILGMISVYSSWISLLLVVSISHFVAQGISRGSGREILFLNLANSALLIVGCSMMYQEVILDTVAHHGGCSAGEVYMEEYKDVVAMLGLSKYRGV